MKYRTETIRLDSLTTGYVSKNKTTVISENINTSLFSGELTCLLGPNGAGKSTLLKTLSGFLPPLSGNIIIEGKDIAAYSDAQLAKVIGVVLTERINLSNMSAYDLAAMGRSPYTGFWGRLDCHDKEVIEEAFSLVGIQNLRDRMVDTLSDGERQKVMIAKALAQETPIIFLDEPTAFLDYPSKVEIMQLLQRLSRKKQKTVFLSTHDLELALQIADKIWLLDKNIGIEIGSPEDLSTAGHMERYFNREGIEFDALSGLFRVRHNTTRDIGIDGAGCSADLLRKALARNGIKAVGASESDDTVTVSDSGYIYRGQTYNTIENLLNAILS